MDDWGDKSFMEENLLRQLIEDAPQQHALHTATRLPLARFAMAQFVENAPKSPNDPFWDTMADVGPFPSERLSDGFDERVKATLAYDRSHLYVRWVIQGAPVKPNHHGKFYRADAVEVYLDPSHDHQHYFQFAVTASGDCHILRHDRPLDSQRWERKLSSEVLASDTAQACVRTHAGGWSALLAIPFHILEAEPVSGRPFGLNLQHLRRDAGWPNIIWNVTHHEAHAPWAFGELHFGGCPLLHVERVDLGTLRLWKNSGCLDVWNLSHQPIQCRLRVTVRTGPDAENTFDNDSFSATLPPHSSTPWPFQFRFDHRDYKWHHLTLSITGNEDTPLWNATYRFGRGLVGWLVQQDDHRNSLAPRPTPNDEDFLEAMRRYIICKLPRFRRVTTAQGAPSDFTLLAEDESVTFNLMESGILQRIADFLYGTFDNDVDRLIGATFFVHQPAIMTYANAPAKLATQLNPLSILRFGNGQCCSFASVLVGLLEKMKCDVTGKPYRATRVAIPGHVTTVVKFRGKWVHLDPSIGRFYFLRDNRTLASMEDILEEPSLAGRTGAYLEAFHAAAADQADSATYYRPALTVWPSGAPEE